MYRYQAEGVVRMREAEVVLGLGQESRVVLHGQHRVAAVGTFV